MFSFRLLSFLPLFTLQMTCFKGVSLFAFLFVADRGLEEVNFDSNVCQETLYPCRERRKFPDCHYYDLLFLFGYSHCDPWHVHQ